MSQSKFDAFTLVRSYPVAPERVFAAFADPARKRRWYAEGGGHAVEAFEMQFEVGGREALEYRMGPQTPFPGMAIANEGRFHDIVPNERIVSSAGMTFGGHRISAALLTVEFRATARGTDLILTHQAVFFEGADGPQMRRAGWEQILARLEKALESELAA